jgi:hypothetical protein
MTLFLSPSQEQIEPNLVLSCERLVQEQERTPAVSLGSESTGRFQ